MKDVNQPENLLEIPYARSETELTTVRRRMVLEVKSKSREFGLEVGSDCMIENMISGKINEIKDDVVKLKNAKLMKYGDTIIYFSLKPLLNLRRSFSLYSILFD
ncbi:MAG: hypothetical protein ACTSR4_08260, partial [Candidatus Hodarchaeales archaeon]